MIAAAILGLGSGKGHAQAPNPLKGDDGAHDPMMFKVAGDYFVYYTGTGIQTKTSKDRITWRNTAAALPAMPAWHREYVPAAGSNLWAPDVHFRAGKYWLYYSVSTSGSRVSAIGLATAAAINPNGGTEWRDQGMVINTSNADDYNAIDPNVYVDSSGTPWLVFGSWWSGIKMFQIDPATGKRAAGSQLYALAYHKNGAEGAFLIKHGEYFYLWLSWDVCCNGASSTYNIRVGRAKQLTGPFTDSKGVALPSQGGDLIDSGDTRWKGPGHNAIFTEGDTAFLVNHAYDAQGNGRATLQIRPLYWTADGWPTLDKSKGQVTGIHSGGTETDSAGKIKARSAFEAFRSVVDLRGRRESGKASPSPFRLSTPAYR
ncbi:MAG: arabinan endo-1,5-alpha-L-arabinosidase [Fibrobacteria bacterium]